MLNEDKFSVLVLAPARWGKDTVAEILRDLYGYKFESSSHAALEHVMYPTLKEKYGYTSMEECYQDRMTKRAEWKEMITAYNTPDKTRLARKIIEEDGNDIYVGMRCIDELNACIDIKLFDLVVWVDASERKPPESKESITIEQTDDMYVVNNNGSLEDLYSEVEDLHYLIVAMKALTELKKSDWQGQAGIQLPKGLDREGKRNFITNNKQGEDL